MLITFRDFIKVGPETQLGNKIFWLFFERNFMLTILSALYHFAYSLIIGIKLKKSHQRGNDFGTAFRVDHVHAQERIREP